LSVLCVITISTLGRRGRPTNTVRVLFDRVDRLNPRTRGVVSSGMLLPSHKPRADLTRLRGALSNARETYRRHRDADRAKPVPIPPDEPRPVRGDEPDVVLDVPRLHVDEIDLKLEALTARVALDAHVLDLLRLNVGVDAELRGVDLKIKGVDAEAQLKVRLENLTVILDRVMSTVDQNPQILQQLTDRLAGTLDQVASGAAHAVGEIGEGARSGVEEVGGIARALAPDPAPVNGRPAP
jgi:uncharacterized protein involved in outer membrane biogenesis